MASPSPAALEPLVLLLLIIVLVLVRRTYYQLQGARFSAARLFGFAAFYVLLFVVLAFSTLYAAVATWGSSAYALLALYVGVPTAAGVFAAPYIERVVRFERRGDGQWYYRLSWHVPVLYLVLFLGRIVAEIAVFGLSAVLVSYPPPAPPSVPALEVLIAVDLLFGLSLGLMIGRGVGVYRAYRRLPASEAAPPVPPSPPLPSG